jgi:hypothetical protein
MRMLVLRVTVLIGVLAAGLLAQQQLNNESILKLHKAGLGEDMIVNMVNTQPGQYTVGVDEVVALKQAGISEKIIAAMMSKGSAPAAAQAAPQGGAYPTEIGVYYKRGGQWEEVLPEVVNWKTGGVLKTVATVGVVKGDVNGRLNGPGSKNSVQTPLEFLIYAAEGVSITEYQLLRLRPHSDGREFRTVTGGVLHVSGGATRDLVPFEGKKAASRTFLVTLPNLGAGEYGFLSPGAAMSSSASAQLGKMYTFHLLE